jgi:hypothetical protein
MVNNIPVDMYLRTEPYKKKKYSFFNTQDNGVPLVSKGAYVNPQYNSPDKWYGKMADPSHLKEGNTIK